MPRKRKQSDHLEAARARKMVSVTSRIPTDKGDDNASVSDSDASTSSSSSVVSVSDYGDGDDYTLYYSDSASSCSSLTDDNSSQLTSTPVHSTPTTSRDVNQTTSEKKLSSIQQENSADSEGRALVDISQLKMFATLLACPECKQSGVLTTEVKGTQGLAVTLDILCCQCEHVVCTWQSSEKEGRKPFVNKAFVFASLSSGMGATMSNNFCEQLDLPGLHKKTFQDHATTIYSHNSHLRSHIFSHTLKIVRDAHFKAAGNADADDIILNIAVTFDGSWLQRGHTSSYGIGCVIDILTGLVIDALLMSKYCGACESKAKKKATDPIAHAAWEAEHFGSGDCMANFTGTSGMMAVHAAKVLWLRSVKKNKLRYTTMLSDGDTKAYNELCKLNVYGANFPIDKAECINHVSKRMGTALRNVVTDASKRKVTLGGRGHGRLTANVIKKFTNYYDKAIRGNEKAPDMEKAIKATLFHCFSTDIKPQHHLCPTGPNSWCFFNSAIASNLSPGPHEKLVHTPLDEDLLKPYLLPVYERLSSKELLQRCEMKGTQNANESLHSVIWSRCRKDHFYSRPRIEFALLLGISDFNFGPVFTTTIRSKIHGLETSSAAKRLSRKRVVKRLYNSQRAQSDKTSLRRQKVKDAKKKKQEELEALEGGAAYQAGQF